MAKILTQAQKEINSKQTNQHTQQEMLVKEWLKLKGINSKTFSKAYNDQLAHKDTLQAIKVARGILDNPKYSLKATQAKQFQNFIIKANRGKNTDKETIDVFRQARAIKRKTVSSLR